MLTEKIKLENEYQSIVNEIIATEDNKKIKKLNSKLINIQIEISKIEGGNNNGKTDYTKRYN